MKLPLEGIRVIDMAVVWAGPFATALLGDLGAEVIKVESIWRWDRNVRGQHFPIEKMRENGGSPSPDAQPWNLSANFNSVGRNKKSVTMDLTRPEGRDAFLRLVERSDMFVENNAPDVLQRLGIGYDVLRQHNPGLIMASLPAFGASGPYRHFRAFGANIEAIIGHTLLRGYTDTDPSTTTGVNLSDATAGAAGAFALLAGLRHRLKTGHGQFIDLSQAENFAHSLSQAYMDYSMNRRVQTTIGNRHPYRAPQGVYRCAGDDAWVAVSCGSEAEFAGLCTVMGRPELMSDARFADLEGRQAHHDELDAIIGAWTADKEHYEAFSALQDAGVPCSPVLTVAEVLADPHLQAREDFQEVTHPQAGTYRHFKSPLHRMSKTPLDIRKHASLLGEDNEYVYREVCGYTDEEYQWFVDNGHAGTVIQERPPLAGSQEVSRESTR